MKIGVISDSHDRTRLVVAAMALFADQGVEAILHCGDITEPATVYSFAGHAVQFVLGNCDHDPGGLQRAINDAGGTLHPDFGHLELAGKSIAWLHGDRPSLMRDVETSGAYDFLFHGHTHVAEERKNGRTRIVNPGALTRTAQPSVAVVDLAKSKVAWLPVIVVEE